MTQPPLLADSRLQRIHNARQLFFQHGEIPDSQLLAGTLLRSWERCQTQGLNPGQESALAFSSSASPVSLQEQWERHRLLLNHAQPIMEQLYDQIRDSGSMVLIANADGMVLQSIGDPAFAGRAGKVALRPGASWDESERGTNAIGTALVEEQFIEVYGSEHFFEHNGFLTCSAAPLFDSLGRVIGVIDISGDYRNYQHHTGGLVRMAAQLVEKRLFESEQAGQLVLTFHPRADYLGTLGEGMIAVSGNGAICAINNTALKLLGVRRHEIINRDFSLFFETGLGLLVDHARRSCRTPATLVDRRGKTLQARLSSEIPLHYPNGRIILSQPVTASNAPDATPRLHHAARPTHRPVITLDSLSTGDARLQLALDKVRRVLGRDIPILIQGESGVGKEMFAKAIHNSSCRASQPFVALNCAAIPENLVESELFGYQGGAFTGSRKEGAPGRIQQAHGGTLFLDEIGDMPLHLQARLLRVLQERSVTPLGSSKAIPVDITLVCATHRRLKDEVATGRFREDLYYRLNGLCVTLPVLRDRSDLATLVHLMIATESQRQDITVTPRVMQRFQQYRWPGNLRQLNNVLKVALALLDEDESEITELHLPEELLDEDDDFGPVAVATTAAAAYPNHLAALSAQPGQGGHPTRPPLPQSAVSLEQLERDTIMQTLEIMGGNISAAARRLGISRNTLYRKIGRL